MPTLEVVLLVSNALEVSVAELTNGLELPLRAASRAEILALVAQEPGIAMQALAESVRLPRAYVYETVRFLEAFGELDSHGEGWQLAASHQVVPRARHSLDPKASDDYETE